MPDMIPIIKNDERGHFLIGDYNENGEYVYTYKDYTFKDTLEDKKDKGRYFNNNEFLVFFYIKMLCGIPVDVYKAIVIQKISMKMQQETMNNIKELNILKEKYYKKNNLINKIKILGEK